ncbi:MAG: hypothetical protein AB7S98_04125 [Burkholderiaceae bacterium]
MSTIRPIRPPHALAAVLTLALVTAGCAQTSAVQYGDAYPASPSYGSAVDRPLSIGDISQLIEHGYPPETIVAEIQRRGLLAPATDADIDLLLRQGASADIIEMVQLASRQPPPTVGSSAPATIYAPAVTVVPDYAYPWGWGPPAVGIWYGGSYRLRPPAWRPPPAIGPHPRPRPPGIHPGHGPGAGPRPPGVAPIPSPPQPPRMRPGFTQGDNGIPLPGVPSGRRPSPGFSQGDNGVPLPGVTDRRRPTPGFSQGDNGVPLPGVTDGRRPGAGGAPRMMPNPGGAHAPGGGRPSFNGPPRGGQRPGGPGR